MIRAVALVALAVAAVPPASASAEAIDGSRIIVIDGDTVALPCAVPARGCAEKIRFIDIDAPESFRPHCDNERTVGLKAKALMVKLLRGQPVQSAPGARTAMAARSPIWRRMRAMSGNSLWPPAWLSPIDQGRLPKLAGSHIGAAIR